MKATFPKWTVKGNENLVSACSAFANCPEAIDLLTQMVQLEPSRRITVKGAMQHPFFAEYNQSYPGLFNPPTDASSNDFSNSEDEEMNDQVAFELK
jgi:serine/threonine protein kinase